MSIILVRKNKKKNKCKYCGKDINVYYADGSYAKTLEYCSDECREAALKEKYGYSICKKNVVKNSKELDYHMVAMMKDYIVQNVLKSST